MEHTQPTDDLYDPDLHGDLESPPAARGLAMALGFAAAFFIWWLAAQCC